MSEPDTKLSELATQEAAAKQVTAALEQRSRELFNDSVAGLDMHTRSRLTRARHAALEQAERHRGRLFFALPGWMPAAGVSAAALLGVALWFGAPMSGRLTDPVVASETSGFEDLEIVASDMGASNGSASNGSGAGDPMEMLQDESEFYDWAANAASNEPAA